MRALLRRSFALAALVQAGVFFHVTYAHTWREAPDAVRELERNLTVGFDDRTALLFSTVNGTVGGAGSARAPLVYLECVDKDTCFPPGVDSGAFVAVIEEALLADLVRGLAGAQSDQGSSVAKVPSAVVALPADLAFEISPAAQQPLSAYYLDDGAAAVTWNPAGEALLSLSLPCGVFLASSDLAGEVRSKAQRNVREGFDGPLYKGVVQLDTWEEPSSESRSCIAAGTCVPKGGNSVWATMPPLVADDAKDQVIVLTHWDSLALFRSIASGAHSAYAGLTSMLVALDILSAAGRGSNYQRTLVFVTLSGEAFDLMASRSFLYSMHTGANATAGLDLQHVAGVVEVGMTAGATSVDESLYIRQLKGAAGASNALVAAFETAAEAEGAAKVQNATTDSTPPSSLLLWRRVLPDTEAVLLTDFDTAFKTASFWGHTDTFERWGDAERDSVTRSAVTLAAALHRLASGGAADLEVDLQAAAELTRELVTCFSPGGLGCDLVQSMTSTFTDSAEQSVAVLREVPDSTSPSPNSRNNIERFVWEFMANRTFLGEPHNVPDKDGEMVGCDPIDNVCPEAEVCMHLQPGKSGEEARGQCVKATARYVPSYSTLLEYTVCDDGDEASEGSDCTAGWKVSVDSKAADWAASLGMPEDPLWTETINKPVQVRIRMEEQPGRDWMVFGLGVGSTVVTLTGVFVGKAAYARHRKML